MKKGEMLAKMIQTATSFHDGQFDKSGAPYILHPITVMHYCKTEDEEIQCIALGHDLIEDTPVTAEWMLDSGFSDRVVNGILALTKKKGQTYDEYKAQVKANPDAVKVKMADLSHNSDIRRIKGVTDKDISRTVKYMNFYTELKGLNNVY